MISGVDLMRHPKFNKGMAFSDSERDRLYLRGLLPPAILSQEVQVERIMLNIRNKESDLDKHTYLQSLQERNERLFYRYENGSAASTRLANKHTPPWLWMLGGKLAARGVAKVNELTTLTHFSSFACRVLFEHFEELLPVLHRPTVQIACQKYNLMFKSVPRALFITLEDRGHVFRQVGAC